MYSSLELQKRTGLTKEQVEEILKAVSQSVLKTKRCTARDILKRNDCAKDYDVRYLVKFLAYCQLSTQCFYPFLYVKGVIVVGLPLCFFFGLLLRYICNFLIIYSYSIIACKLALLSMVFLIAFFINTDILCYYH